LERMLLAGVIDNDQPGRLGFVDSACRRTRAHTDQRDQCDDAANSKKHDVSSSWTTRMFNFDHMHWCRTRKPAAAETVAPRSVPQRCPRTVSRRLLILKQASPDLWSAGTCHRF